MHGVMFSFVFSRKHNSNELDLMGVETKICSEVFCLKTNKGKH